MANSIQNRLVVTAEKAEDIKLFLESIESENEIDNSREIIDFNRIIPMPMELRETEASSISDNAIFYYLNESGQTHLINNVLRSSICNMDSFKNKTTEELDAMYKLGEQYVDYYKKYGAKDWYDWSIKNWGTKWNAYGTYSIISLDGTSVTLFFQTAWSGVSTIIAKLTEMFPELVFEYAYADEDMGYNCGTGWGQDGEYSYEYIKGGTEEAMQTFALCWDYDFGNFYQDDEGCWHNREWEEDEE